VFGSVPWRERLTFSDQASSARGEQVEDGHSALRSLAAAAACLVGLTAASSTVAYEAAVGTEWSDWLGTLGWTSICGALGAVALGLTALMTRESHRGRIAATAVGAGLGLVVLVHWYFTIQNFLDTT
jgi:hypothetical protein